MGATEFDKPLDNDLTAINTNLGSPTSASGVTGADAFTKINTVNTNLGSPSSASSVTGADAFTKINTLNSNLGSPTSASGVTGADAFTKINTLNSNLHPKAELSSISEIVTLLEKPENNGYALFRVTDVLNNSLTGVPKSATVLAFKTSSVSDYIEFISLDYDGDVRTGSYKISTGAISTVCQASIHIGSVTGTTSSSGNASTTFSKHAVILSAWSSSGGCVITPYPGSGADDSGQYTWWFHVCSDAADNHVIANTSLTVYYTYMLVNG